LSLLTNVDLEDEKDEGNINVFGFLRGGSATIPILIHCRDKEWDVVDLRISGEEDGSLSSWVAIGSYKGVVQQPQESIP
jgi:hypothetical protein